MMILKITALNMDGFTCGLLRLEKLKTNVVAGISAPCYRVTFKAFVRVVGMYQAGRNGILSSLRLGGEVLAGKNLKTSSRWGPNGNGTDSFGFSALPAGYWGMELVGWGYSVLHFEPGYAQPYYDSMGDYTAFWSSTEFDECLAYSINLATDYDDVKLYHPTPKYLGFSIRCVKDR